MNSRPPVYLGEDINSNTALTPGHFLSLNPKTGIPVNAIDDHDPDYNPCESSTEKLLKNLEKKGQKVLKYCHINKKREKSTLSAYIHVVFS